MVFTRNRLPPEIAMHTVEIHMIDQIDHLVLTTTDETACVRFYVEVRTR